MEFSQNRPKKSLGQHFLTSEGAVANMVESSGACKNDVVLEIGPGKGVLTTVLLKTGAKVVAVEKDDSLIGLLTEKFTKEIAKGKLVVIHGDILTEDVSNLVGKKPYKLVANIPYYITGEIIRMFLTAEQKPVSLTLLIQKEVAERIVAKDDKESVLSLSVKFFGQPVYVSMVKRGSFYPIPNVDSAILRIEIRDTRQEIAEENFFIAVKAGFKSKRKKLISNLGSVYEKNVLNSAFEKLSLDQNTRAEDVGLEQWLELLKCIN